MSAGPVEVVAAEGGAVSLLPVRAQPGARRRGIAGTWNGRLRLAVTAPAEDGRANEELLLLVAELFRLRPSAVSLVRGHSARQKTLRLEAAPEEVRARLRTLFERDP